MEALSKLSSSIAECQRVLDGLAKAVDGLVNHAAVPEAKPAKTIVGTERYPTPAGFERTGEVRIPEIGEIVISKICDPGTPLLVRVGVGEPREILRRLPVRTIATIMTEGLASARVPFIVADEIARLCKSGMTVDAAVAAVKGEACT